MLNSVPLKINAEEFKKKHKGSLLRRAFKKVFSLPYPDALPSKRWLSNEQEEEGVYTWEDWREEMKKKHPIKYFLNEDVTFWISVNITKNIEHGWYWLRTNTYNRYHLLDLRQPKSNKEGRDKYRWGWIDQDTQILYACFNILVSFYEVSEEGEYYFSVKEFIENYSSSVKAIEEEIAKINTQPDSDEKKEKLEENERSLKYYQDLLHIYTEIQALYDYWTVERKDKLDEKDRLLTDWSDHRDEDRRNNNTERWDNMNAYDEAFEQEETDMLIRLMKIRKHLWN